MCFLPSAYLSYFTVEDKEFAITTMHPSEILEIEELEIPLIVSKKIQGDIEFITELWEMNDRDIYHNLKDYQPLFYEKWGNDKSMFFYYNIFKSPEEIIDDIINGFTEEGMLDILEEQIEMKVYDLREMKKSMRSNDFLRERFMDILNNKLVWGTF